MRDGRKSFRLRDSLERVFYEALKNFWILKYFIVYVSLEDFFLVSLFFFLDKEKVKIIFL